MKTIQELESALKPLLTDEFLSTLKRTIRTAGWDVDLTEMNYFYGWCLKLVGKNDEMYLEPYDYEE